MNIYSCLVLSALLMVSTFVIARPKASEGPGLLVGLMLFAFVAGFGFISLPVCQTEIAEESFCHILGDKQPHESIVWHSITLKSFPLSFETYNNRGVCYALCGEYANALKDFDKAIRVSIAAGHYNYDFLYANRGYSRFSTGDFEGALKDFDICISKDRDNAILHLSRGKVKMLLHDTVGGQQDFHKAINVLTKTITLYQGGGAEEHFLRGRAWDELGEHERAVKDYKLADQLSFRQEEAFNRNGGLFKLSQFGWLSSPRDGAGYKNSKLCGKEFLVP